MKVKAQYMVGLMDNNSNLSSKDSKPNYYVCQLRYYDEETIGRCVILAFLGCSDGALTKATMISDEANEKGWTVGEVQRAAFAYVNEVNAQAKASVAKKPKATEASADTGPALLSKRNNKLDDVPPTPRTAKTNSSMDVGQALANEITKEVVGA
jgi:hypothetical protein